ncbi:DUF805 domain-containing protein [Psychrobacillus sp. L4]|uniref:DUF805 domain-containing protein n=1 Tax=Psychrobacillus sp. L4 TaxID=3236892 RepID=UPI0036F1B2DD
MYWYLKALKNYVGFKGRARRKEYWMFILFDIIISIVFAIVESIAGLSSLLTGLYSLVTLLPALAVTVRRLHDTGRSGWWFLLNLIPLVGPIIVLVFTCQDGQNSENKYGTNPKR